MSRTKAVQHSATQDHPFTYRESVVMARIVAGDTDRRALIAAGFPMYCVGHPSTIISLEMRAKIETMRVKLVAKTLERSLVDAVELHERLTDHMRGDVADLYSEDGELLPMRDWPLWARQGGVEILDEPNMVPSADGGGSSWDQVGRRKKIRVVSRHKTEEMIGRLKAVNAFTETKSPDLHVHLHAEITSKLQGAMARKERIIEAERVEPKDDTST